MQVQKLIIWNTESNDDLEVWNQGVNVICIQIEHHNLNFQTKYSQSISKKPADRRKQRHKDKVQFYWSLLCEWIVSWWVTTI